MGWTLGYGIYRRVVFMGRSHGPWVCEPLEAILKKQARIF